MTELNYYKLKTHIVHFTILDKFFGKLPPEVPGCVALGYIVQLDENRFKHRTLWVTIFYLCVIFFKMVIGSDAISYNNIRSDVLNQLQ